MCRRFQRRAVYRTDDRVGDSAADAQAVAHDVDDRMRESENNLRIDRRRSPRRSLRKPIAVRLCNASTTSGSGVSGALLNVSAEGLACRLAESDLIWLKSGRDIRVRFALPGSSGPFELRVRVVNITRACTPDQCVIGLEYLDPADGPDRCRLSEALEKAE